MKKNLVIDNPELVPKVGDRLWITSAEAPSEFEVELARQLEAWMPDALSFCVAVFSLNAAVAKGTSPTQRLSIGDASVFVIHLENEHSVKLPENRLLWSGAGKRGTTVSISFNDLMLEDQFLLVLAKPFFDAENVETPSVFLAEELGLVAALFAFGIMPEPVFSGSFGLRQKKLSRYSLQLISRHPLENKTVVFSKISDHDFDVSGLSSSRRKALRLTSQAFRSKDGPAKWIFYRAAIEQLFGKRSQDNVRKFYHFSKPLSDLAYDTVKRTQTLREDVLHRGEIGELTGFEERVLLAVVFDGISFDAKAEAAGCTLLKIAEESGGLRSQDRAPADRDARKTPDE